MRLTPEPKRSGLYAVYAWMRRADDVADQLLASEGITAAAEALDAFERRTRATFAGGLEGDAEVARGPERELWQAFADTVHRFGLTLPPLLAMIQGQRADLTHTPLEDRQQQRRYCEQVASSVGHVCLELWGYQGGDRARALAADRGVALQMTNILRDLREDREAGRCYLPLERLRAAGVPLSQMGLPDLTPTPGLLTVLGAEAKRAAELYEASADLEACLHPDGRRSSAAMAAVYRELLDRICRDPGRVLRGRVRLSTPRKVWVAWRGTRL